MVPLFEGGICTPIEQDAVVAGEIRHEHPSWRFAVSRQGRGLELVDFLTQKGGRIPT